MFDIGLQEMLVIGVLALLVFGPSKLPELGRMVGRAMREFRRASDEFRSTVETNLHINDIDPPPPVIEVPAASEPAVGAALPSEVEAAIADSDAAVALAEEHGEPFCAQRGSRIFHRRECTWARRIPEAERSYMKTIAEAKDAGLTTCPVLRAVGARLKARSFLVDDLNTVEYGVGQGGAMRELTTSNARFSASFAASSRSTGFLRRFARSVTVSRSPRRAFDHLRALERKGMLQRRATAGRTSRSLVPSEGGAPRTHAVPILGRVAAGQPLLAAENREGELHIAAASLPGRGEDVFALRVRGDSMIEAHICDGDLVLVRRQDSAQPNEIVVAMVESESGEAEATVKASSATASASCSSRDPTMAPIVVDPRGHP